MNINEEARKDPEQLEREVDEQRAHLGNTLNALEQKLSPGHLFDQVMDYTRANGGEFSQNLVNTVKRNPVPTLLTAVGLTWLFYGQQHPTNTARSEAYSGGVSTGVGDNLGRSSPTAGISSSNKNYSSGSMHDAKNKAAQTAADAKHRAGEISDKMRQHTRGMASSLRDQSERTRAGFNHLLEDQPLALGAIGIAIGALLGGSLPATAREDQLLGEYRDSLASKASSSAKDAYEKASEVGHKVASDVKRDVENSTSRPSYQ